MKRGQSALEFVILFVAAYLILFSFFYLVSERTSLAQERQEYDELKSVTNVIYEEVLLASKVRTEYARTFELPPSINGNPYQVRLHPTASPSEIIVSTKSMSRVVFLPVNLVTGSVILPGNNLIRKDSLGISVVPAVQG